MNKDKPLMENYKNPINHVVRLVTHANDNISKIRNHRHHYTLMMQRLKQQRLFRRKDFTRYHLKQLAQIMHKLEVKALPISYEDMISSQIGRIFNSFFKHLIIRR